MEIHDVRGLTGFVPVIDADATSILGSDEPLVLRLDTAPATSIVEEAAQRLRTLPTVTVVIGDPETVPVVLAAAADICLTTVLDPPRPWVQAPIEPLEAAVAAQPKAALALVSLLRSTGTGSVWDGIVAEASTYGLLLGSAGFQGWLASGRAARSRPLASGPPIRLTRDGAVLRIELDRPAVHNAIDSAMRDELVAALSLPLADPTITEVRLSGLGPSFSSGGDLDEFGSVGDPATSLAVRLTCHPGYALHQVEGVTTAYLHGSCIGAGIEVPAFAHHVSASPNTTFRLPELTMGLIPGAGGTVSLRRRIGRHRTAWLALTTETIDVGTALAWGLVDDTDRGDLAYPADGSLAEKEGVGRHPGGTEQEGE